MGNYTVALTGLRAARKRGSYPAGGSWRETRDGRRGMGPVARWRVATGGSDIMTARAYTSGYKNSAPAGQAVSRRP
jgi:hypothetical protein